MTDHSPDQKPDSLLVGAFCQLLCASEDCVFVKSAGFDYVCASPAFARAAGLDGTDALPGKTDFDLFPPELAEAFRREDQRVLLEGADVTGRLEKLSGRDGIPRWTRVWKRAVRDSEGNAVGICGFRRDVTDLVGLEEEAAASKRNADLIRNMPGGVGILHRTGDDFRLDYLNDGWSHAHHLSPEKARSLVGASLLPFIHEPDRKRLLAEYDRIDGTEGAQGKLTYQVRGEDDALHWISVRFRFAYESAGTRYYYASYADMDEQKKAEEQLLDSQNALREAVANSDIQFFTYFSGRKRCEIYAVNRRLSQLPVIWDNFPDDFLAYTKASPEDARAYREMLQKIDEGEDSAECTVQFAYRGVYAWERICIRAVRDPDGRLVKGQGYSLNVTSRKSAEARLRQEQLRLKTPEGSVFEAFSFNITRNSSPDIQTADQDMLRDPIPEEVTRQALRVTPPIGSARAETRDILLRAAARIPDPSDRELFFRTCGGEAMRSAVREGQYSAEICYRRLRGNAVRWVATRAEVLPDPSTGDMIAFFYTRDINDEMVSQKMSARIMDMNYEAVASCDLQSGELYIRASRDPLMVSPAGQAYAQALSEHARRLSESPQAARELEGKLALERILAELEKNRVYSVYCKTRQEGPEHPSRQLKADIFYLDEHRDLLVFLLTDVTEIFQQDRENRDRMAAALAAAKQASAAKSNFLSRMSHEIRTPLNAIIGMDTIAAQSLGDPERTADCISKIGISARYLLSLINDILDMSRIESGKMLLKNEKFLFRDFISGINTMIYNQTRAKGLDYECTVSSEIAEAYIGDAMKLQQVLINILGNAVKFTEKGKVSFFVHPMFHKGDQSTVRFSVNDTGIGIREDFIGKLFEPFEQSDSTSTTPFGGTGLGLAITKNLVNLMGGTIRVRSIVGVGSEFTVDIPLTVDESVLVQPKLSVHFEKMHTLIVDDDLVVCEQTSNILRDIGMAGEWVTSGTEALERVTRNCAKSIFYDFILVDWKMPDMNGIETTRQIRRIVGPDVTIIIITAYDWESIETEAKAAGANLLVSKPLLKSTLVSAFQKAKGQTETEHVQKTEFDFTGRRVLVAEDNQINAEIAKSLLESKHFQVELAVNGQKALELYAQNPSGYYDVILMDIRMPLMDGLQTTTNIRHWNKADARTIPIIAMTANAFDEDVDKSKAVGMNAHLSKPIDPDLMFSTLYRILYESE